MGEFSVGANFKGRALVGSNLLQVPETSNRQDIASSDRAESTDVTDTLNRFFYMVGDSLESIKLRQICLRRIMRDEEEDKETKEGEERNKVDEFLRGWSRG